MEGAKDRVTIGDLRTRDAGLLDADPLAVWLEFPSGGDGLIPTWAEFIHDLIQTGVAAAAVAVIRGAYKRWQDRGARSPYGFIDLVFAREEWSRTDLAQLLGLNEPETTDLLEAFGFEPTKKDPNLWRVSKDKKRTKLRRKLRREE
jgi:hypothetical protein